MTQKQKWDIVIIGGGLAGYVAANYLAETKLSILLLEKANKSGGRARTNIVKNHYFNFGPHALYKKGKASSILEELKIKLSGRSPKLGGYLVENDQKYAAPFTPLSLFSTQLLHGKERLEWATVLLKVISTDPKTLKKYTFEQWVKQSTQSEKIQSLLFLLSRLATYCHAPERVSAKVMVTQMKSVMNGVLYIDGGWQTIIDQLHNKAVMSGINIQTHRLVKEIHPLECENFQLTLANEEKIYSRYVLSTVGPKELYQMFVKNKPSPQIEAFNPIQPVQGASLDVALTQLPNPNILFAMGLTDPLYYSVHSDFATLSEDRNSTVLHVFKYYHPNEQIETTLVKNELQQFLEKLQPGWQNYEIASRFIPKIIVNQRLPQIQDEQRFLRSETDIPGLYIAGDWTSSEHILADAAVYTGKTAAEKMIQKERSDGCAN